MGFWSGGLRWKLLGGCLISFFFSFFGWMDAMGWLVCWFVGSYPSVFLITSMAFNFLSSNERRIRAGRAGMDEFKDSSRDGFVLVLDLDLNLNLDG